MISIAVRMNQRRIRESSATKTTKDMKIVNGKKELVVKKDYVDDCKEGYKRDSETGQCVRMDLTERRDKSISATKAANKSSTKINKANSDRRRDALIKD